MQHGGRFKRQIESESTEKVNVVINQQDTFKAGDINKFLSVFQVLNPEIVIFHMEPNVKINLELSIDKGRGYVPAEENKSLKREVRKTGEHLFVPCDGFPRCATCGCDEDDAFVAGEKCSYRRYSR